MRPIQIHLLSALTLFLLATTASGSPFDGGVEHVSVSSSGAGGDDRSNRPAISVDGRFVAFESESTNLVPDDTNDVLDIFVHDRHTGSTERVSRSSVGSQGNGASSYPSISADGRYVAFSSHATNLVPNDTNDVQDIFLHDRVTGFTSRVSIAWNGLQADFHSSSPVISGNGEVVAFASDATNLFVFGNDGARQVYIRDTVAGQTYLCSVAPGAPFPSPGNILSDAPHVSFDGNRIVFESWATNLTTEGNPATQEVFLFDRSSGTVSLVSRGLGGAFANDHCRRPVISGDGASVAFNSFATNLIPGGTSGEQVFLCDVDGESTVIVSTNTSGVHGNDGSIFPSISHDGKRVAFWSNASNLAPGLTGISTNVFIRDMTTGTTVCMSRTPDGQEGSAFRAALSPGGDFLAFASRLEFYVPGDLNDEMDVFVRPYGVVSRNGGSNPSSYRSSRAVIGEEWRASVDLTTTGHSVAVLYGKIAPTNTTLGGGQRLLISGPKIFKLGAQSGPIATWSAVLPHDSALAGLVLYTQAVHLLGLPAFALSNAQDLCLTY